LVLPFEQKDALHVEPDLRMHVPSSAGKGAKRAMSADHGNAENNVKRWQMLEAEALTIASRISDPEPKRIMLTIAIAYGRLAERAALRLSKRK
jgi:hypothetical protein